MGILSGEATLHFLYFLQLQCDHFLKEKQYTPFKANSSFKRKDHLERAVFSREANRKSHILFPFVKMAEKYASVPIPFWRSSSVWVCQGNFLTIFRVITILALEIPKKQTTKFSSAIFQKMLSPSYIILRIQRLEGKQCISR